jgi:mannose-6-phosphate isomerase-like protein (cupin superfamily)
MAKSGSVIYNKVTLDTFEFRQTREDTGGALLQFDDYHPPNGIGPLPHRHPLQEEAFTVLNGTLAITIDGTEKVVEDGGKVAVPPNAVHFWRNAGSDEMCLRTEFRPALHFEEIIETYACMSQIGKVKANGDPDPLQMSAMMNAYPGEFYLGEMPMMLQRFLFGPFGYVLRRFLGFKPHLSFADLQAPDQGARTPQPVP